MEKNLSIYLLNTLLLLFPIVKQFMLIVNSPEGDQYIVSKTMFFVFSLLLMAIMWLCYMKSIDIAGVLFTIIISISIWSYYKL